MNDEHKSWRRYHAMMPPELMLLVIRQAKEEGHGLVSRVIRRALYAYLSPYNKKELSDLIGTYGSKRLLGE